MNINKKSFFSLKDLRDFEPNKPSYAVLGKPIAHSLSPLFQNAAFKKLSLDAVYIRVEVAEEELEQAVNLLVEKGFLGWNCTSPLKKKMASLCNALDKSATLLGSVNTVLRKPNNFLVGYNTDGSGWAIDVKKTFSIDFSKLTITVLGTGGVGEAIAKQSALEGSKKLILLNRTYDNALTVARNIEKNFNVEVQVLSLTEQNLKNSIIKTDLFIQSLPLLPFKSLNFQWEKILHPHILIYDLLYFPMPTPIESIAKRIGCKATNGLGMLIEQGALSFSIWTGLKAPIETMRKSVYLEV
ncbi:shikimate dehydrogenase family protein [Methylacidiphilum caldifontis]|uniref:shikimate dehydrogenase family protein n=1 Tax=Methylacidiphilum caldifontis TaxID=2795386 RepID=UPI001FC9E96C|nr:shikimate dehydrogenase [Methylacidiphilum caldifontis]